MKRSAKWKPRPHRACGCRVISWVDVAVAICCWSAIGKRPWTASGLRKELAWAVEVNLELRRNFGRRSLLTCTLLPILGPGNSSHIGCAGKLQGIFAYQLPSVYSLCPLRPSPAQRSAIFHWRTTDCSAVSNSSLDPFGTLTSSHLLRGLPSYPSSLRPLACVGRSASIAAAVPETSGHSSPTGVERGHVLPASGIRSAPSHDTPTRLHHLLWV